jgi:tetratricopeptide (TPR) repeat protein
MDLSLLESLRQQSSQLASQRHEKSDSAYQQALAALSKAQASGFKDKIALKEASQMFLKAIQMARGKAEPYVGMAYLLLLLGQQQQAVRYLTQARDIDPDHQDTQKLLSYLQNPAAFAPPESQPPQHATPPAHAQERSGLNRLERSAPGPVRSESKQDDIRTRLTELSYQASQLPLEITLDRKQIKHIEKQLQDWEDCLDHLQEDIADLEMLENVNGLQRSVQVLERRIEKLQQLHRDSLHLSQVREGILDVQFEVRATLKDETLEGTAPEALEERLEHFLDECDRLADLIDEAEGRGLNTQSVAAAYEALASDVEQFQDAVDDLK